VKKIHNQAVALEVYAYKAKDAVPIREVVWIRSERCEQRFAVQLMEESSKHILAVGRSPAGADRGQTRKRPDNDGDWQSDRRPERPTRQPKVLKAPIEPTGHPTITITAGWGCCGGNGDRRDTAGIGRGQRSRDDLFDHIVGAGEQHGRNGEAERPRGR
jgi:hypothetical protein